ncbi:MAG: aminopeptidase [Caldilineales bacterium]|nr:aminopeptidase [Caldilineales bacterium]
MSHIIENTDTLDSIRPGARTAVRTCLNIGPSDRVFILSDEATAAIGQALAEESESAGATVSLRYLEEFGQRPILAVPAGLNDAVADFAPTASFFAAQSKPGEIGFRMKLRVTMNQKYQVRHGHMVGITPRLMREGMTADYDEVYEITQRVTELVRDSSEMRVTSDNGTDFRVTFSPDLRWVPCHGRYHEAGQWGNLPEGETYTSPANVDGVLVANVLGDHFSEKYGVLDHPVIFHIESGIAVRVECADKDLEAEINDYLDQSENGRRVGEFAIGTNTGLTGLSGNLLQDEKLPGVHVAFGNPYPHSTGAMWTCDTHVDVIPIRTTIDVDGRRIMTDGVFTPEILA